MNDIFGALRDWLLAQIAISDLVGTRVYVNAIPRSEIEAQDVMHPSKMLVIRQGGGQGTASFQELDQPNIIALCYGESESEADAVRRAVWTAFKNLRRVNQGGVLIHHVNPTSGAIPSRDPDIKWPIVSQTFQTLVATESIA